VSISFVIVQSQCGDPLHLLPYEHHWVGQQSETPQERGLQWVWHNSRPMIRPYLGSSMNLKVAKAFILNPWTFEQGW